MWKWLFPPASVVLPTYDGDVDSIDLQVRSLSYCFKRFRLHQLAPFVDRETGNLQWLSSMEVEKTPYFDKLDAAYATDRFIFRLQHDEYRVLCDYCKNKVRAMCILQSAPSVANPELRDDNGKTHKGFKFMVMPRNPSRDEFARFLAETPIYYEHFSSFNETKRTKIALAVIGKVTNFNSMHLTSSEKTQAVWAYLQTMAETIQINRIYIYHQQHHVVPLPMKPVLRSSTPDSDHQNKERSRSITPVRLHQSPSQSDRSTTKSKIPAPPTNLRPQYLTPDHLRLNDSGSQIPRMPSKLGQEFKRTLCAKDEEPTSLDQEYSMADATYSTLFNDSSVNSSIDDDDIDDKDYLKFQQAVRRRLAQERDKLGKSESIKSST